MKKIASLYLISAALFAQGVITSPAPGAALSHDSYLYSWTAAGSTPSGVLPYYIGFSAAGCGGQELYGAWTGFTSQWAQFPSLTGPLYVTLWFYNPYPLQLNHCYTYSMSASPVTASIVNTTLAGSNASYRIGDGFTLTVHGPANSPVSFSGAFNGSPAAASLGSTDGSGNFVLSGTMGAPSLGAWVETWAVAGVNAAPISFNVVSPSPVTVQMVNTTTPAATAFVVGESYQLRVTGPANSAVSWSGTHVGVSQGGGTIGTTDASGLYVLSGTLDASTIGQWNETWTVAGSSADVSFNVLAAVATDASMTAAVQPGEVADDNYTGGTVVTPTGLHPTIANAVHKVPLKDGRIVEVPRGDNITVAYFAWRHAPAGDFIRYTWTIDARQVYMIRVGLPDDPYENYQTPSEAPRGWSTFPTGWGELAKPVKGPRDEFSLTSKWRPGLVPVFIQGSGGAGVQRSYASSDDNERIAAVANIAYNSVLKYSIGPAIAPDASKADVLALVKRWVNDYGFDFLSPLLDGRGLETLAPVTELDKQVVECLRAVL